MADYNAKYRDSVFRSYFNETERFQCRRIDKEIFDAPSRLLEYLKKFSPI